MSKIAVVGPFSRGVSFEVHHAECSDLNKARNRRADVAPSIFDAESRQEVIEAIYADHISEGQGSLDAGYDDEISRIHADWRSYAGEFKFLACVENLGGLLPIETPDEGLSLTETQIVERLSVLDKMTIEPGTAEWCERNTLERMFAAI